jgi:hypothetical protein
MTVASISTTDDDDDKPKGINSLTAAESAMAERKAGQSITTLGNDAYPQVQLIGALGWMLARRDDPRLQFDAYMSSHKVNDIARELGIADDDDDEGEDDDDGLGPESDGYA